MRILVGFELSGVVRRKLRDLGHDAWSCDLLPALDQSPFHITGDARPELEKPWDAAILFPPCTDLAVSGARYFAQKRADGRQQASIDLFMSCQQEHIPKIAVENPVGIMSRIWRKPDQIIHPWQFGHPESKTTCLWLKNLPKLVPTDVLQKPAKGYWDNQCPSGQNKLGPSATRAMVRGITYDGIAQAMADQWFGAV